MSGQQKTHFHPVNLGTDALIKQLIRAYPSSAVKLKLWQIFKLLATHVPEFRSGGEPELKEIAALFDHLVQLSEAAQAQFTSSSAAAAAHSSIHTSAPESPKEVPHA